MNLLALQNYPHKYGEIYFKDVLFTVERGCRKLHQIFFNWGPNNNHKNFWNAQNIFAG